MKLKFRWHSSITELDRNDWNRLALPLATPFLEWEWLASLEQSNCVGGQTGWIPRHLSAWRGKELVAAAPLYLKLHGRGEFVFDQEWAEVAFQLGIAYYPKLVGMSPFTPAPGYRFLVAEDGSGRHLHAALLEEIDRFCGQHQLAGCHFLHVDPSWRNLMVELGVLDWLHHGLTWLNRGFSNFEDYLKTFKSRQRNKIRVERGKLRTAGFHFRMVAGEEAPADWFSLMYGMYAATCAKFYHWSHYLNREFFERLAQCYARRALFSTAWSPKDEKTPVAMSFLIEKEGQLFGRYWGCREAFRNLHFETCYYQPIQYATHHGLRNFDAGSGGAVHKRRRGFPARPQYSLHRLYHPTLEALWRRHLPEINLLEQQRIDHINGKRTDSRRSRK